MLKDKKKTIFFILLQSISFLRIDKAAILMSNFLLSCFEIEILFFILCFLMKYCIHILLTIVCDMDYISPTFDWYSHANSAELQEPFRELHLCRTTSHTVLNNSNNIIKYEYLPKIILGVHEWSFMRGLFTLWH